MRLFNRGILCFFVALLLVSCGPDPIVGKWGDKRGPVMEFDGDGTCHSAIKGGSPYICEWKRLGNDQYNVTLESDVGRLHGVMHIQDGKLLVLSKKGPLLVGYRAKS
jgi:hypothetical protein